MGKRRITITPAQFAFLKLVEDRQLCTEDADFSDMNLQGHVFKDRDLCYANFSGANLKGTKFINCNLRNVNFSGSNLTDVVFSGPETDLGNASWYDANVRRVKVEKDAYIDEGDFWGQAKNPKASTVEDPEAPPKPPKVTGRKLPKNWKSQGYQTGYKRIIAPDGTRVVATLLIAPDAKVVQPDGHTKKRASAVFVLDIENGVTAAYSSHDRDFWYFKGHEAVPDDFDSSRARDCSNGLHFFDNYSDARNYPI